MKSVDLDKIKKEKSIRELLNFSILNIDKPAGPTSFQVDLFVKKQLGLNKTSISELLTLKLQVFFR